MTREPEMVKAYRDTWELGLHSYLTYLRDRALVTRELLAPSGSVFVQISEDNLHLVRDVLDETFGAENFVVCIIAKKTGSQRGSLIQSVTDYILWYAKDKASCASYASKLFVPQSLADQISDGFNIVELSQDEEVPLNKLLRPGETQEAGALRVIEENPEARLFASGYRLQSICSNSRKRAMIFESKPLLRVQTSKESGGSRLRLAVELFTQEAQNNASNPLGQGTLST